MPDDFIDYVMELFGPFGTVGARRTFGGHGVYPDGLMFAIVSEARLYLEADEMKRIEFEQADCEIFGYTRKGKRAALNFFRAQGDAMESPELMLPWARSAYAAALRANAKRQIASQAGAARIIAQRKAAEKETAKKKPPNPQNRSSAASRKDEQEALCPLGGSGPEQNRVCDPQAPRYARENPGLPRCHSAEIRSRR